jgi:hypothetical protein
MLPAGIVDDCLEELAVLSREILSLTGSSFYRDDIRHKPA